MWILNKPCAFASAWRRFACWLFVLFTQASFTGESFAQAAAKRPNFVFFLTDDQRYDKLSIAGDPLLKTPNLDRLAREGAWFRNAFVVNSLCAPSRASFLTGKYGHTTGVTENSPGKNGFRPNEPTIIEHLKAAGYEVGFVGKSHIEGALRDRPFDDYFGFEGQGTYFNPKISSNGGPDIVHPGYVDDILADHAVQFLKAKHEKPFFLFVWFKAPHRSWSRPPRLKSLYEGLKVPEPPTFRAGYGGKPQAVANADMKIGSFPDVKDLDQLVKDYDAVVTAVDENVGKVLSTLDSQALAGDTVVIHSSDNGFFLGEWNFFDKRLMYEPSLRIPLLMRWPGRIAAGLQPTELVLNIDLAPTILELAGAARRPDIQGRSLVPLLDGKKAAWRNAFYYEYFEYPEPHRVLPHRGVRTDRWKFIHFFREPQEFELYDLQADPNETRNLSGLPEHASTVAEMKRLMLDLRRESSDPDLQ